jgi:hypothetical protein
MEKEISLRMCLNPLKVGFEQVGLDKVWYPEACVKNI